MCETLSSQEFDELINVNDIERVEVLKNGTALYGAKAADGVVLIQTKRNKSMATKIDVTINGQYELVPKLPNMMNSEEVKFCFISKVFPSLIILNTLECYTNC